MFIKLQTKIILIMVVILLLTIGTNNIFSSSLFMKEYSDALKNEVFVIGQSLKLQMDRLLALDIPFEDVMGFEDQCQEIVNKYSNVSYASVVNADGQILFHSDPALHKKQLQIPEILNALRSEKDNVVAYTEQNEKYYGFVIAIVDTKGQYLGAVVLGLPVKTIAKKVAVYTAYSTLISICFFALALFLTISMLSLWVTKPLIKLDIATKEIGTKGTDSFHEVDIHAHDEIGRLAGSFNTMALELQRTTVSKEYMDNIISSMIDALIVIDTDIRIKTVNKAASELLGYSMDELLGKPISLIFSATGVVPFQGEQLAQLIKNGELKNFETTYQTRTGRKIPILLSCSVMKDTSGELKYIVCTSKDITERKQAEDALLHQAEKLARSNAELQEFAYVSSHDLQEPLRKISAFSDRLVKKYTAKLDEAGVDYLNRIQNATIRMQTLINDLLAYSRISTKAQPFVKVDLSQIAADVISNLEMRVEQTNGQVEISNLPVLDAEPTQMYQLFQNLIGNALKFHRPGTPPLIKVHARLIKDMSHYDWQNPITELCEITFEDNGIGIEAKYYDRIFGVFQRLHNREEYEGTGVGLAICQKIIERHNGTIKVTSTLGAGTKFIVNLPVLQKQQEENHS